MLTYVGAQAAPVDCKITKHGCCWDNRTIAKGPHNKGCPGNTLMYHVTT